MAGITFFKTKSIHKLREFYQSILGLTIWRDQEDCIILRSGNLLLGFCSRDNIDDQGMITFFYSSPEEVDAMYFKLKQWNATKPVKNDKYNIYQFFAKDPENRTLEFQCFLHHTPPFINGEEMLITRRSIRHFKSDTIPITILEHIFETCRFSPTSKNSQSYYFIVISDREKLNYLAATRESASAPIGRAPLAVAICSDPEKTKRPQQDACIAAYHFLLSAWLHGIGNCWIAAMDREDVKTLLDIPQHHYIATITPLGYPQKIPSTPARREASEIFRFI